MRNLLLAAGVAGLIGLVSACGDDKHAGNIGDSKGGRAGGPASSSHDGGEGGADAASGGGDGTGVSSTDPRITITAPLAVNDPADGVLTKSTVEVLCTVEQGVEGAAIDATSVTLAMLDAAGKELKSIKATSSDLPNEYTGSFVLETVPTGKVSFKCSASDKEKHQGATTISTFVDHGPKITVVSPKPTAAFPLIGGLAVEFTVEPAELVDGDAGAEVDEVSFTLDNKDIPLEEASTGHYTATIFLDDADEFPVLPTGSVAVTATNKRSPTPVSAKESYNILIDGIGPVITIQSPAPQAVVGGKVTLAFTVTDAGSGVDAKTVNVKTSLSAQDNPQFFNLAKGWKRDGDKYTFVFDSKGVEQYAVVQTTINIRATDSVGNESASGQSLQLYLDNVPPMVDLDPENIRTYKGSKCSGSFDPLGAAAVNDLDGQTGVDTVSRIDFFRAFVFERTNSIPNQQLFYFSGTDPSQVRLYVGDPDSALLVNKNPLEDDTCDEIGGIDQVADAPMFSALKPISATGNQWNRNDPSVAPLPDGCPLEATNEPTHMCPSHVSDLWDAPKHPIGEPLIYVAGTPGNDDSCTGIDLEFATIDLTEGWVCVAARAVDKAGNVGISPPLRLCMDDLATASQPDCRIMSTTPPTCTDGCTAPARGGNIIFQPK